MTEDSSISPEVLSGLDCRLALVTAATNNDIPAMEAAVAGGANISKNDTAIFNAAFHGNFEAAKWLLERKANISNDSLQFIASSAKAEMVALLLAHGADYRTVAFSTLLEPGREEVAALVAATAAKRENPLPRMYQSYLDGLQRGMWNALAKNPPERHARMIDAEGKATRLATCLAITGLLAPLFKPSAWKDAEPEGLRLYHDLRRALPHYTKGKMDGIDITGLTHAATDSALPAAYAARVREKKTLDTGQRR